MVSTIAVWKQLSCVLVGGGRGGLRPGIPAAARMLAGTTAQADRSSRSSTVANSYWERSWQQQRQPAHGAERGEGGRVWQRLRLQRLWRLRPLLVGACCS